MKVAEAITELENEVRSKQSKSVYISCMYRSYCNDVAVHDCQLRRIIQPYKDAQNILLWRDNICLART